MIRTSRWAIATLLLAIATRVQSQPAAEDFLAVDPVGFHEGWRAFADLDFMMGALLTLVLAAALGAAIAYHPRHLRTADTLQEIEAPKVYILCAVIGALIGMMVVNYGPIVGFIMFGMGGLLRFRTLLGSASLTVLVIFVTLIGLACGLNLPHVAVLATAFGYVLVYCLNLRTTYRLDIRALEPSLVANAALAYRQVLEQAGCRVARERKSPQKGRATFIVHISADLSRSTLEERFEAQIDPSLQGAVDWQME